MAADKKLDTDKLSGKKVKIRINKTGSKFDVDPVPVSLNGTQYTIRRGEEVIVPIEIVEVLNNATEVHYEQIHHNDGSATLAPREAPAYPFQILGVPA